MNQKGKPPRVRVARMVACAISVPEESAGGNESEKGQTICEMLAIEEQQEASSDKQQDSGQQTRGRWLVTDRSLCIGGRWRNVWVFVNHWITLRPTTEGFYDTALNEANDA
ncbi:MAG: hypothetical protein AAFV88_21045 [Planctomycetota bacterium]